MYLSKHLHESIQRLYADTCDRCGGANDFFTLSEDNKEKNAPILEWFISTGKLYSKYLNNAKLKEDKFDKELCKNTVNALVTATGNLNLEDAIIPNYTQKNHNYTSQLVNNIFSFAGAKTYRHISDLNKILIKNGDVIPFPEFNRNIDKYTQDIMKLEKLYNKSYLQAEWQYAKTASIMASKFQGYLDHSEFLPNLKYTTAGDSRVRKEHEVLDGIVKPIKDKFWEKYYPPNGWRCRCDVYQVTEKVSNYTPELNLGNNFENNVALNGVIFSNKHPYFEQNEILKKQINEQSTALAREIKVNRQKQIFENYKNDSNYKVEDKNFNNETGGFLIEHKESKLLDKERETINKLIDKGDRVVSIENINAPFKKNPDIFLNNEIFDIKKYEKINYEEIIKKFIESKYQSNNFILDLNSSTSNKEIKYLLKEIKNKNLKIKNLIFLKGIEKIVTTENEIKNEIYFDKNLK